MEEKSLPKSQKYLAAALICCLILFFLELVCFAFFSIFKERFTFYDVSRLLLEESKIEKAKQAYDFELGWRRNFDTPFGERPRPKKYSKALLATYGDSYTYCDQVLDHQSYQYYLAAKLKSDVYNFGVGGYGTDQAYLRFKSEFPKIRTPLVALGLITENINRTVNIFRNYYYSETALSLTKPRFVLKNGSLELIENPLKSKNDISKLRDVEFVRSLGRHDWWYNLDSYPELSFPYTAILFNRRLWLEALYGRGNAAIDDIDPRPWENLWQHPEARQLMFAIIDAFVADAKELGAEPLILVSPRKREVLAMLNGEEPAELKILLQYCQEKGYHCFDGVSAIASQVKDKKDLKNFYYGHLTPQGNLLFARKLFRYLVSEQIVDGYRLKKKRDQRSSKKNPG